MRTGNAMALVQGSHFVSRDFPYFTYYAANDQSTSKAEGKNNTNSLDAIKMAVSQNSSAVFHSAVFENGCTSGFSSLSLDKNPVHCNRTHQVQTIVTSRWKN